MSEITRAFKHDRAGNVTITFENNSSFVISENEIFHLFLEWTRHNTDGSIKSIDRKALFDILNKYNQ
ncbi:hypothetical protein [Pectinatus frisingensis]|uniref:hypothetical protein n=1 Tax=Pectinatus frisingensis TaxID=865 RepID=UPI0018C6DF20|nr:hypothetical protein [Pectinatus frisingensis]